MSEQDAVNQELAAEVSYNKPAIDKLVKRVRSDPVHKDTPIIIITSRVNPEHRRRARELAVRALVAKPITRRKLLEALATR